MSNINVQQSVNHKSKTQDMNYVWLLTCAVIFSQGEQTSQSCDLHEKFEVLSHLSAKAESRGK